MVPLGENIFRKVFVLHVLKSWHSAICECYQCTLTVIRDAIIVLFLSVFGELANQLSD